MTQAHSSAAAEWRAHWPMVAAAMVGLSFTTVGVYSIGLFMEPLAREFGWTRAQISAGLSIVALFAVPLSLPVGALIDRWGSRRLAIPGVILTSFAFAAFASANGSLRQWFALWICYGIVAVAIKTTVWTAAVSSIFAASRALALAVVLCGAALSQTIAPLLAQWLIDDYGWRTAFLGMGIGWGACVLVLLLPFFFDARDYGEGKRVSASVIPNVQTAAGLTLREGLRNPAILRIAAALTISTVMGVGIGVHKVPILGEAGISREFAARLASSAGVAGILGKLLTGWMLDRWRSGWIAGISLSLPAFACAMLLEPIRTTPFIVMAVVIFGYSSGAYLHVCTYLTTQYGGLRHFGKIFGVMASLMALATGVGPVMAGAVFDAFGSYVPLLLSGIPAALVAALLVGGLGPYPQWHARGMAQ